PVGPLLVADQLPESEPQALGLDIIERYEDAFGKGSATTFISNAYDGYLLLDEAVPVAAEKAKPGTTEFRTALRDALENIDGFAGTQGIYTMSPDDHVGLDDRARVIVRIEDGKWVVDGTQSHELDMAD